MFSRQFELRQGLEDKDNYQRFIGDSRKATSDFSKEGGFLHSYVIAPESATRFTEQPLLFLGHLVSCVHLLVQLACLLIAVCASHKSLATVAAIPLKEQV
ncbi:hypothetical protein CPC08DRAFT_714336 [Agrocybe pediades]|nr:hypothetical protein CPC08DRAFT_714336 [Agrocybe pediades]